MQIMLEIHVVEGMICQSFKRQLVDSDQIIASVEYQALWAESKHVPGEYHYRQGKSSNHLEDNYSKQNHYI